MPNPAMRRIVHDMALPLKGENGRFLILAGAVVVGALLLRIYRIGEPELWTDEAFSFYVATTSTDLLRTLLTENTPPLYYLVLRLWVRIAGISEASLRLPSAIIGTLFVAAVIWAGTTFFNRRVGLWAGAFAAIAPMHIYYSQEARAYVLAILFVLLAHTLIWRALERQTLDSWSLVAITVGLALYSHYFSALALLPSVLLVWVRDRPGGVRMWRAYGTAMLGGVLMVMPWFVWSLAGRDDPGQGTDFLRLVWENTPPALAIPKTLETLGLGSQAGAYPRFPKIFPLVIFPDVLRVMGIAAVIVLGVWVAGSWKDRCLGIPDLSRRKAWLWASLLVPLFALSLISLVHPIYLVGRYDIIAFPAYALVVGLALAKAFCPGAMNPMLRGILVLILVVPIGTKLLLYYQATRMAPALSSNVTAALLKRVVRDGDVVVFTGLRGLRTRYYLNRYGVGWSGTICEHPRTHRRFGCRMYPRETEDHLAVYDATRVMALDSAVQDDIVAFQKDLAKPDNVLWVVLEQTWYVEVDERFTETIKQMGYKLIPIEFEGVPGVFQARR